MDLFTDLITSQWSIKTIEMHTCGEPVRIVISGYPTLEGATLMEKRRFARDKVDWARKRLMLEPRGHSGMYGAILIPETELPEADIGVLFIHNEGYSTMCGHATIALARMLIDTSDSTIFPGRHLLPNPDPITSEVSLAIHTPCGLVRTFTKTTTLHSRIIADPNSNTRFHSVPSFLLATNCTLTLPALPGIFESNQQVTFDLAFGGAFYALITTAQLGFPHITRPTLRTVPILRSAAAHLVRTITSSHYASLIKHPSLMHDPDIDFLYGAIVTSDIEKDRQVKLPTTTLCIFAGAQVDRSPCGSGVSALVARAYANQTQNIDETCLFGSALSDAESEGIDWARYFTGMPVKKIDVGGDIEGVIVEVGGRGFYSGVGNWITEEGKNEVGVKLFGGVDSLGSEGFTLD